MTFSKFSEQHGQDGLRTKVENLSVLTLSTILKRHFLEKNDYLSDNCFENGARGGAPQPTLKTPTSEHSAERPHAVHREARNFWVT